MKSFFFMYMLLSSFYAFAQTESEARQYLNYLNDSLSHLYGHKIDSLKARYKNGDKEAGPIIDELVNENRKGHSAIFKETIKRFPDTEVAAEHISWFYFEESFDTLLHLYDLLGPVARQSNSGHHAAAFIERGNNLHPGLEAPSFSQPDTSGKPVSLQDYRGKYLLLEFWASWRVPCRAENPNIKAAYTKYNSNGFEVLGISMDKESDKGKWLKAIHEDGLPWQQVSDLKGYGNEVFFLYNVMPIPDNYLIGPDGKIIARGLRGKKLNDKLVEIFKK